jgi:hypothetical protein
VDSNSLFATQSFVWGLHGICTPHRIPFARSPVLRRVPPPYKLDSLRQAKLDSLRQVAVPSKDVARVLRPVDVPALKRFTRSRVLPQPLPTAQHARAEA